MRVRYIRSSSMRKRCHPVPCWSYLETTLHTLLVLPEDDLLPNGIPCRLQSRCTLLDRPKPVSSGLNAVFRQVVTSGLRAVFHQGVTSGLKAIFHPTQGGNRNREKGNEPYKKPRIAALCTRNRRRGHRPFCTHFPTKGKTHPAREGQGQAERRGSGREKTRDPRIPPLAKWDNLLPLGRGERHNPRNQGTRQQRGYHCAGPGKNPSRKGRRRLDRGSAITMV